MYDQYFREIVLNQNYPVSLNTKDVLTKENYINFENNLIHRGRIIANPKDLESAIPGDILLIYYDSNKEDVPILSKFIIYCRIKFGKVILPHFLTCGILFLILELCVMELFDFGGKESM